MNPDDIENLLRAARPTPPEALRLRVLAAALAVEPSTPWWALIRTWAAAAVLLAALNLTLMSSKRAPALAAEPENPVLADLDDEVRKDLSPIMLASLRQSPRSSGETVFVLRAKLLKEIAQ